MHTKSLLLDFSHAEPISPFSTSHSESWILNLFLFFFHYWAHLLSQKWHFLRLKGTHIQICLGKMKNPNTKYRINLIKFVRGPFSVCFFFFNRSSWVFTYDFQFCCHFGWNVNYVCAVPICYCCSTIYSNKTMKHAFDKNTKWSKHFNTVFM